LDQIERAVALGAGEHLQQLRGDHTFHRPIIKGVLGTAA
jgi:hypothetical protein